MGTFDEYLQFADEFLRLTGIDLSQYKRQQMERRLTALRDHLGFATFRAFAAALARDAGLLRKTLAHMTINVSEFFRNPDRWWALMPLLAREAGREFRVWSAACASGEEPYTIAMLLEEHRLAPYHILATDIDEEVLRQAQAGCYHERQLREVPEAYLQKYFVVHDGTWQVAERLKRHVQFVRHDLLRDPYPAGFDLIVCRNVLIYFTDEGKDRVVRGFARALRPGGLLFVGSTEQFLSPDRYGLQMAIPFVYRKAADGPPARR
ncbi:chemotaxis protein methyltransferase [Alicyclobacillus cellulosilyticus]|uniref:protein-glutamate O-methyltransferase n=1 Tax=Alicyclobacillus cellulosilyticus TaxID=1003997 RepID=A0A917KEE2_9BACL|nr:protein-glutamate O-methyltransferase CheR [Alicyclobacillus cellulosilyticus]GGJ11083.1 chemotaxis protein methyltransferase [Alicyclobacillus cellulosilyticus]